MSYTPTNWESDDVVTATRMNALETAVGEMNMSYTPNTWVDGDVLTAAKMNALEQAVASGGGGGSSDFSTAEVTIINSSSYDVSVFVPYIDAEFGLSTSILASRSASETIEAVLYEGTSTAWSFDADVTSVTGDATLDDGQAIITGDCTITIS